ncbi:MAG: hypothetical protein KDK39_12270 [Leptospiraceae bacterium]|nr:hypothetical protein [Leptospiraceae bacterium]
MMKSLYSLSVYLLVALVPLLAGTRLEAQSCLELRIQEQQSRLQITGQGRPVLSQLRITQADQDFKKIYQTLESNESLGQSFTARLNRLGAEILGPFQAEIQGAECVLFVLPPGRIYYMLDLLPLGSKPLYLQKPVAYALQSIHSRKQPVFSARSSALILRDPDTDPENGAGQAAKMYRQARLHKMKGTPVDVLDGARADILLLSAHGGVTVPWEKDGDEDDDSLDWNDDEITAAELEESSFKLLYLDSCQMGISHDMISAATETGASYYMAPVISNEAGNSSTKSIVYFFRALASGQSPLSALFQTRRQIYNEFKGKKAAHILYYYSFPFRLYLLR